VRGRGIVTSAPFLYADLEPALSSKAGRALEALRTREVRQEGDDLLAFIEQEIACAANDDVDDVEFVEP